MGIHCQCHIQDEKVIIYSDQGEDYTSRLPTMVKEAKAIAKGRAVVYDFELEWWKGGNHQAREVTAGHFNPKSKESIDDSEAMANVFDCLYDNEDTHKLKQSERLKHLESFKWPQSTIGKPNLKYMFNLVPYELVSTGSALKSKAGKYIHAVASEGMMLKEDAPYSLTGASSTIYKLKTFAEVHGIVWKKIETKTPNVWNYDYALSFTAQDKIDPKFIVEVKGKEFTNVGRSLNTAVNVPVGGIITIRFHTINLYTDAKTGLKHIGVYEPRFYEYRKGDVSPDSFSSAVKIGRDSGLLIEKAMFVGIKFLKKGETLLVDEEFDVVEIAKEDAEFLSNIENKNFRIVTDGARFILKQDPYLHLPPEDKQYKYGIQHHWRRRSVHADDRNETE